MTPFRNVLSSEIRRLLSRRVILVLAAAALVYWVWLGGQSLLRSHRPSATLVSEIAEFEQDMQREFLHDCKRGTNIGFWTNGLNRTDWSCNRIWIYIVQDHFPDVHFAAGAGNIIANLGSLGFFIFVFIGATFGGADISSRQLTTILLFEPRRLIVFGAKLGALSIVSSVGVLLLSGVILALWFGAAAIRGSYEAVNAPWFWQVGLMVTRNSLVWTVGGALGFSFALMTRSTLGGVLPVLMYFAAVFFDPMFTYSVPATVFEVIDWFVGTSTGAGRELSTLGSGLWIATGGTLVSLAGGTSLHYAHIG